MSIKYLGNPFDMHGGGRDLVFPHHENERAQAECATGRKFVNYWVHNGFVTMDREKMSKSIGNFLLIKDFLKTYHPEVLRLFFLSAHYRNPVDYAHKAIDSADSALRRLYATLERVSEVDGTGEASPESNDEIDGLEKKFFAAMDDDFNTALALSSVFDLATAINRMIDGGDASALPFIVQGRDLLISLANLLGLLTERSQTLSFDTKRSRHLTSAGLDEDRVEERDKRQGGSPSQQGFRASRRDTELSPRKGHTSARHAAGDKVENQEIADGRARPLNPLGCSIPPC